MSSITCWRLAHHGNPLHPDAFRPVFFAPGPLSVPRSLLHRVSASGHTKQLGHTETYHEDLISEIMHKKSQVISNHES